MSDAGAWMTGTLTYDDTDCPRAWKRCGSVPSNPRTAIRCRASATATPRAWPCWSGTSQKGTCSSPSSASTASRASTSTPTACRRPRARSRFPPAAKRHVLQRRPRGDRRAARRTQQGRARRLLGAVARRRRQSHRLDLGGEDRPRQFQLTNDGDFDVTDAAPLPDGGLLVLERRFRVSEGVRMRLRLIKQQQLRAARDDRCRDTGRGRRRAARSTTWKGSPHICGPTARSSSR